MPDFPEVIDSSIRADYVSCGMKFNYARLHSLAKSNKSIDLHFGGCFAKGLEAMRRSYWSETSAHPKDIRAALAASYVAAIRAWGEDDLEPGKPTTKTLDALLDALASYLERYPPDQDIYVPYLVNGEPQIECTFALPIPGVSHPDTGKPVLYAGRYDMLAQRRSSAGLYIEDDKTTSRLGDSWTQQWKLRGQFTGYCWAAREFGLTISGVLIRGVGILKSQITHAEALESRSNFMIDRWLQQLTRDVSHMIEDYRAGVWDQAFDHACAEYGGCIFQDLCHSPVPERWMNQYVKRSWNPLERD